MMKRMLAFLCVLALLVGMYVVPASAAETSATVSKFDVGFAKGDINPWVYTEDLGVGVDLTGITYTDDLLSNSDPNNADSAKIIKVPLAGYANSTERLSEFIRDDDGSGTVGQGDGIFFTCTTVTDANGYVLFMFTSDTVSGYDKLRTDVAAKITELMAAEEVTVTADQVTLSGSHSHGGPDFNTMRQRATREENAAVTAAKKKAKAEAEAAGVTFDEEAWKVTEAELRATFEHTPQYVLWEAYYDYVVDKMATEAVNAWKKGEPATLSKGQIDASEVMYDKGYLNESGEGVKLNQIRQYITQQYKQETILGYPIGEPVKTNLPQFVSGAHLNTYAGAGKAVNNYTYTRESIAVADDTMYIMQFTFDDENLKPIIQVNWRAHATMLGTVNDSGVDDDSNNKGISSDYINSFRKAMEGKYNVAFIQGAAGNIVPGNDWVPDGMTDELQMATYYGGTLLAEAAVACLAEGNMQEQNGNIIRANHLEYQTYSQTYSEGLVEAAKDYINKGHSGYHPKPYLHTDGKYYYINSSAHANAIYNAAVNKTAMPTLSLSAYMLGDGVAIVTAPNELFDRYSLDVDTLVEAKAATDNDWNDLVTDAYGMPFVFGYTNGHSGYLADSISYTYNDKVYDTDEQNGLFDHYPSGANTIDGVYGVGVGSYEANAARYAQGTGEAVVAKFGEMLSNISYECERCGEVTSRTALTSANVGDYATLTSGHYYLDEDISYTSVKTVEGNVCLDLNGHTIKAGNRAFYCKNDTGNGTVFSLMDSSTGKTGAVIATTENGTPGGVVNTKTSANITFNLYGGTLKLENTDGGNTVEKGGVVCVYGTMNMYGGTIEGAVMDPVSTENADPGCGAAIYVFQGSTLNVYGGKITNGQVAATSIKINKTTKEETTVYPKGNCVYLANSSTKMTLSGNAEVGEIYIAKLGSNITVGRNADGILEAFSGKATLDTENLSVTTEGIEIGTVAYGTVPSGFVCTNEKYRVKALDGKLMAYDGNGVAHIEGVDYQSIEAAIDAFDIDSNSYIQLLGPVEDTVTVDKDVRLDLNGYNVASVAGSGTLYCLDTETDDFDVNAEEHTGYGKIGTIDPATKVYGVPAGTVSTTDKTTYPSGKLDGYLMVTEDGYGTSFHRVNLQLTHMTLRAKNDNEDTCNPSVYYKSAFAGDQLVAQNVESFGVALSKTEMPDESNMGVSNLYSTFDSFTAGSNSSTATSTLLYGVMKEANGQMTNKSNANKPVYGRAYIKLKNDKGYVFGVGYSRTLKQQTIDASNIFATLGETQRQKLITMFDTYRTIVKDWDVTELIDAVNDEVRILGIGNSFTGDSMRLLGEVYKAENPDKKLVLGYAYYSGCTLAQHMKHIKGNEPAYIYYKLNTETGAWEASTNKVTLEYCINAESWNIVTMQQGSASSGNANAYNSDLVGIQSYVNRNLGYKPTYLWNMTWAFPVEDDPEATGEKTINNSSTFLEDYGGSQMTMYNKITEAVQTKIVPLMPNNFTYLVPAGTAIQNANADWNDWDLYHDYCHLNDYGRYIVAYTYYCELNDITADELTTLKMTTIPGVVSRTGADVTLTEQQRAVALKAIKAALTDNFTTYDTTADVYVPSTDSAT